jgi:hypothetical protein
VANLEQETVSGQKNALQNNVDKMATLSREITNIMRREMVHKLLAFEVKANKFEIRRLEMIMFSAVAKL